MSSWEVKPEIIAVDATISLRPGNVTLDEFYHQIREKYPEQLLMADCSTVEEALHADELGFDFIGTTMVGYTEQSKGDRIEANDFEIIRTILSKVKHHVIAEGNINTPEKSQKSGGTGLLQCGCRFYYHKTSADYKIFYRRNEKSREINHKGIPHCSLLE